MGFVLHLLGQLALLLAVTACSVGFFYLVVYAFVPKRPLPESMSSGEGG